MTETAVERKHARLAPSSASRWINCPGSIRLSEGIEGESSVYAAEGTAAHELAAHCLRTGFEPSHFLDSVINLKGDCAGTMFGHRGLTNDTDRFLVTEEMVESVEIYIEHVNGLVERCDDEHEIDVELRLNMTHVHPDIFGTGDATVLDVEARHLHVCDFKYGRGVVVDVEENPQLGLYGAGAARRYHNRGIRFISLYVIQPRAPGNPIRSHTYDILDLLDREKDWAEAATRTEDPDAPLNPGEWCRFCPALHFCEAVQEQAESVAFNEFSEEKEIETMTPEAMADVLRQAEMIGNWVKAVQAHAHKLATEGNTLPGFKLVNKRANRKWIDEAPLAAVFAMEFDLDAEDYHVEPKLRSPAQIEKLVGKKNMGPLAAHIIKKSSGTNLVPESDKRPAAQADAAAEFA